MRTAMIILLSIATGCAGTAAQSNGPDAAAGPSGGSSSGGSATLDAGHPDAGGGALDAGGADAANAPDASLTDGGFACEFPDVQPPMTLGDGGRPPCELQNTAGQGHFSGTWEGRVFGELALTGPFDFPASGTMTYEIFCGGNKLLVDGTLQGLANANDAGMGFPFSGRLYGELDPTTGAVSMMVNPATLTVAIITGTFKVAMRGARNLQSGEMDGDWCGVTIDPQGGNGFGTWAASPVVEP